MANGTNGGTGRKITLLIEGQTEKVFLPHLRAFLRPRLTIMPDLDPFPYNGRIPTGSKLERVVRQNLKGKNPSDHVIALTDVYTGQIPPAFADAADAKSKMRSWVGSEPRFHPHAAQFDFEAWLLPYWSQIQRLAGHNRTAPGGNPELVNHNRPPSSRIKEIFLIGSRRHAYVKPRDAGRILDGQDLSSAINQCSELKALVNSILKVCDGAEIP